MLFLFSHQKFANASGHFQVLGADPALLHLCNTAVVSARAAGNLRIIVGEIWFSARCTIPPEVEGAAGGMERR